MISSKTGLSILGVSRISWSNIYIEGHLSESKDSFIGWSSLCYADYCPSSIWEWTKAPNRSSLKLSSNALLISQSITLFYKSFSYPFTCLRIAISSIIISFDFLIINWWILYWDVYWFPISFLAVLILNSLFIKSIASLLV
jgi:hypothetical protein